MPRGTIRNAYYMHKQLPPNTPTTAATAYPPNKKSNHSLPPPFHPSLTSSIHISFPVVPGALTLIRRLGGGEAEVVLVPVLDAGVAADLARGALAVGGHHGQAELVHARGQPRPLEHARAHHHVVGLGHAHLAALQPAAVRARRHPVHCAVGVPC